MCSLDMVFGTQSEGKSTEEEGGFPQRLAGLLGATVPNLLLVQQSTAGNVVIIKCFSNVYY